MQRRLCYRQTHSTSVASRGSPCLTTAAAVVVVSRALAGHDVTATLDMGSSDGVRG